MKRFTCPSCSNELHFSNDGCVVCGTDLAFDPARLDMVPAAGQTRCANAEVADCNWLAEPGERFCRACRHNRTVPDHGIEENRIRWAAIELAKRQLFYSLIRWNLPLPVDDNGPWPALAFDFLTDETDADGKVKPVLTGHANGLITLNIAEGDDAEREARRTAMGEPFRTLVGHMRHEVAHYYWEVLVRNTDALDQCRRLFGDDSEDYGEALQRHYANGAPNDWPQSHVSSYATAHPWEDFAETFAHWMHMVDGLETAWAYGINAGQGALRFDPYAAPGAQSVIDAWVPVSIAINAVNRSLGQPDLYPFVLSAPVIDKLQFIHGLIAPWRA
ncbi:zinc-binding metallopeptidase family protein [Oceaniglobus trochenteri]|uniref:zinc-binding metallopeptidase family protein n=1 Tax=Oceaniglobus trochenteri TaxID=2763260 RepID=UPI001CFFD9AA|nr:putative zinc-binding metallopeptidase [Oceaniglobus trochenteri]